MTYFETIALAILGFGSSWLLIRLILQWTKWSGSAVRSQQFHQTHAAPISRLGGVGLAVSLVVTSAAVFFLLPPRVQEGPQWLAVVVGSLAMFFLGLLDDLRPLNAKVKFLVQITIAIVVCFGGDLRFERITNPYTNQIYELGFLGSLLSVFWLVAVTNLINLTDGLDGLAGGICFMVLCLMSFLGVQMNTSVTAMLAIAMAGAVLGFLNFNFPPARIYMGDGGAYLLGFLIAALSLANSHKGMVAAALFAPACALTVPIYDVVVAIVRRGARGLPLFRPDKKHLHHRLSQLGLSPKRAVTLLYVMSLMFVLLGLSVFWTGGRMLPPVISFAVLLGVLGLRSMARMERWIELGQLFSTMLHIRRETQYALALGRWLELAAKRAETSEEVWSDFQFLVRKLKFTTVTLRVGETERRWVNSALESHPDDLTDEHQFTMDGQRVVLGITASPNTMAPKVFFILAELAAEGWLKASLNWQARRASLALIGKVPAKSESP